MAVAMVICIAAFIWLYVQIGPLLSDFVSFQSANEEDQSDTVGLISVTPESETTPGSATGGPQSSTPTNGDEANVLPTNEPAATPTESAQPNPEQTPEGEDNGWEPTHQIREGPNVNFRSGPNTISQTQGALPPGTPLRFLGDEEPAAGVTWMHFDIQDGTEGWIRDLDVIEYDEDAGTQ